MTERKKLAAEEAAEAGVIATGPVSWLAAAVASIAAEHRHNSPAVQLPRLVQNRERSDLMKDGERATMGVNLRSLGLHRCHVRPVRVRGAGDTEQQRGPRDQSHDDAAGGDSGHGPEV